jgi:hypothetical protein
VQRHTLKAGDIELSKRVFTERDTLVSISNQEINLESLAFRLYIAEERHIKRYRTEVTKEDNVQILKREQRVPSGRNFKKRHQEGWYFKHIVSCHVIFVFWMPDVECS